jgi:hypothetical protein
MVGDLFWGRGLQKSNVIRCDSSQFNDIDFIAHSAENADDLMPIVIYTFLLFGLLLYQPWHFYSDTGTV